MPEKPRFESATEQTRSLRSKGEDDERPHQR